MHSDQQNLTSRTMPSNRNISQHKLNGVFIIQCYDDKRFLSGKSVERHSPLLKKFVAIIAYYVWHLIGMKLKP